MRTRYYKYKRLRQLMERTDWADPSSVKKRDYFDLRPRTRRQRELEYRRIINCVHKWVGGGQIWTACGYEYEPPTCIRCGDTYDSYYLVELSPRKANNIHVFNRKLRKAQSSGKLIFTPLNH